MSELGWELVTEVDAQNPQLGDLRISGTRLARLASFGDQVRQACQVTLKWWLGEWFLDRRRGTPYIRDLLKKGVSEATARAFFRRELLEVEGVAQVGQIALSLNRSTRVLTVTDAEIVTTEGERLSVPLSGEARF